MVSIDLEERLYHVIDQKCIQWQALLCFSFFPASFPVPFVQPGYLI